MIATTQQLAPYLDSFTDFQKTAAGAGLPWLRSLREEAFARFCEVGFPTTKVEDWRFTNVSSLAQTPFRFAGSAALTSQHVEAWQLPGAACRLVFVNGRYAPRLSSSDKLPRGVHVTSLASQLREKPAELERQFGAYLNTHRDPFCALNTAFAEDGAYVHISRGVVLEGPLHLLFVTVSDGTPSMSHPRNLVIADEDSQVTVVEDYVSIASDKGTAPAFCNTATELIAGNNAVVSHYMIEREDRQAFNISTLRIQQGRSANVSSHSLLLGGGLVRNNVHPVLAGEGGECLINGLFIGSGRQHMDNYMLVEHAKPHCDSRQFYNGILDGHAHGVFHGRIIVHKDAQKTDAKQTNRNLLLSDDAQIDTKPQLEIYADDVKCTHGATIGQIEENALFYLRSRGLDEVSARKLLLSAFARECLDRMKDGPAKKYAEGLINDYLFEDHLFQHVPASQSGQSMERERNLQELG